MEAFATVEVIVMVVKLPYVGNRGRLDATYVHYCTTLDSLVYEYPALFSGSRMSIA